MTVIQPPSYLQGVATAPQYSAEDDRQYLNTMAIVPDALSPSRAREGLLPGPSNWLADIVSTTGMDVTISPFRAIVQHTIAANAGDYRVISTANETRSHDAASATLNRIDLVGVQVEDEFYAGSNNQVILTIVRGSDTSGTPVAPTEPDNFLLFWEARIDAGATTPAYTDRRRTTAYSGGVWTPFSHELSQNGSYAGQLRALSDAEHLEQWDGTTWVALPRITGTHARFTAVNSESVPHASWHRYRAGTAVFTCPHITMVDVDRWRIETDGVYTIEGGIRFNLNSTGNRHHAISDDVNDNSRFSDISMPATTAGTHALGSGFTRYFSAGQIISQWVWQNSGGPLDTNIVGETVHISFTKVADS